MMNWKGFLSVALFSACLSFGVTDGQGVKMVTDIPFEFNVGESVLPPGSYKFVTKLEVSNLVLEVSGDHRRLYRIILNGGTQSDDGRCEVVFNKYQNGSHFLAEVRIPGQPVRMMTRSRSEKEIITTDWSVKQIALALRPATSRDRD